VLGQRIVQAQLAGIAQLETAVLVKSLLMEAIR
jgi:hypothetical protein